jgi:peptide/nickel transport system substrate-binding protein
MKTFRILIFISVLLALAAACSRPEGNARRTAAADAPPAYGDILVDGSIGDASNLIPILASDSASHDISGLVFNVSSSTTRT